MMLAGCLMMALRYSDMLDLDDKDKGYNIATNTQAAVNYIPLCIYAVLIAKAKTVKEEGLPEFAHANGAPECVLPIMTSAAPSVNKTPLPGQSR